VWDFLAKVLEHGGTAAALYFLTLIGVGAALLALWKQNQAIHTRLVEVEAGKERERKELAELHAKRLRELTDAHAQEVAALVKRLDEIQDRRVNEAQTITEKVLTHIAHIDRSVEKLGAAVDVLVDWGRGRGGQGG